MDKSVINVWPIVLDPSDFSLLLNPDADSDYFFSDGLGGGITSDVTIRTQVQPYLVERSIFVPYDKHFFLLSRDKLCTSVLKHHFYVTAVTVYAVIPYVTCFRLL